MATAAARNAAADRRAALFSVVSIVALSVVLFWHL